MSAPVTDQSSAERKPATALAGATGASVLRQFYVLTKPRVVQLIVFCALIGMVLAVPGLPG